MTSKHPTASVYVRLSRLADGGNLSLEGMTRDLRAKAARLGADVLEPVHVDNGLSGSLSNRPAFKEWLADAREGRAQILLASHVDRMSREGLRVAADILDVIETTGVRLVDGKGLDSAGDETAFRLQFVIQAEVARAELKRIRERAKERSARARDVGHWQAGQVPFGYRVARCDGHAVLEIDPDEAAYLTGAARRVLDGEPVARITAEWNRAGRPVPHRGGMWASSALVKILTGAPIRGLATHNGRLLRDESGEPRRLWPPIVDDAQAAALAAVLAPKPGRGRPRGSYSSSNGRFLTGILRCGGCGGKMLPNSAAGVPRYACGTREGACPGRVAVNARNVEAWAESVLLHEGFRSEPERKIVPRVSELGPEAAEKARLRDLIAELQRRAEETEDDDEAAALFRRRRSLIRTLREVEQEVPRVIFDVVRNTGRTIEQAWAESDTDGRREILLDRYGELSVEVSKARYPSQPAEQRVHVDDPAAHDDLVPLDG